MLQVMLCGAADTDRVRNQFADAISDLGGVAWHYQSGDVLHINSSAASWERNSRATVKAADLCVFVVLEAYGDVTWEAELDEALAEGTPFLILCLQDTYQKYLTLSRGVADLRSVTEESDRALVSQLRAMESDMELTVVPFEYGYFGNVLRRQLSTLFGHALNSLAERNRRESVAQLLGEPTKLSRRQLEITASLAIDETEEKTRRKRAVQAIADRNSADMDTIMQLLRSTEQGVQRLTITLLSQLCAPHSPGLDFLSEFVAVANSSDDVGVARRLIPAVLDLSLPLGCDALLELEISETGLRRRLTDEIEAREAAIVDEGLSQVAVELLQACLVEQSGADWKTRCSELVDRLASD